MGERRNGFMLVFATAIISGISIFLNRFAIATFNPFVFTTLKNTGVAFIMASGILLAGRYRELLSLKPKEWRNLILIGLVGGSIPFLLFFWGLKQTAAANASLLHKSLFIPASVFAYLFLKERLSKVQLVGAFILFIGVFLLSGPVLSTISIGDYAIMAAVIFWAAENTLSKHVLNMKIPPHVVVFGRMFFGSIALMLFLLVTSSLPDVGSFTLNHLLWLSLTIIFLLMYQLTFYSGLARLKVGEATSVLIFGSVVTTLLSLAVGRVPSVAEMLGGFAIVVALAALVLFPERRPVLLGRREECAY